MARRLRANGANGTGTEAKPKTRKPRGVNAATSAVPQSNVSDDTIRELCLDAIQKKDAQEKAADAARAANAEYRAVLKRAKKLGVLPEAIVVFLHDRKLEIADVSNRLAQQNRIYKLMKLPVGTQLGFDLDGKTIATAIEDDGKADGADGTDAAAAAYDAGHDSGVKGIAVEKTAYTEEHKHWLEFLRGRADGMRLAATKAGGVAEGAAVN